mmetsp:Transcript_86997/g.241258  ORF Transcript_86997/g.241258 Transcript_86997/m.241258 type:complete len:202 (-) Transcript_86997:216-821(-)
MAGCFSCASMHSAILKMVSAAALTRGDQHSLRLCLPVCGFKGTRSLGQQRARLLSICSSRANDVRLVGEVQETVNAEAQRPRHQAHPEHSHGQRVGVVCAKSLRNFVQITSLRLVSKCVLGDGACDRRPQAGCHGPFDRNEPRQDPCPAALWDHLRKDGPVHASLGPRRREAQEAEDHAVMDNARWLARNEHDEPHHQGDA